MKSCKMLFLLSRVEVSRELWNNFFFLFVYERQPWWKKIETIPLITSKLIQRTTNISHQAIFPNFQESFFNPLSAHQRHKMVKHTQTIRRQQHTNCLSVIDHFLGLALTGLKDTQCCFFWINPFQTNVPFLYPRKTSENIW